MNKTGLIAELTKKQSNREYFGDIPVGTKFIIIEEHGHMPAYDLTGYFINYPPQKLSNGAYHFTGYIEKGSWRIVGEIQDNIKFFES